MYEKCIIFTILFVLFSVPCSFVFASADTPSTTGAFVTTWETTAPNESITIPVGGSSSIYTINWGDGTVNTNVSGNQTHQYAALGNHTVSISGNFSKIALGGDSTNAAKLRSIDQWGSTGWTSMDGAFGGASNMIYNATDSPDLLHVTNMSSMFEDAISFDGDLSGWNVSSVTDMSSMFLNADSFTGDLSGWDVSSVTDMSRMFMSADSFTGDLSGWNVSSVTDMSYMFWFATNFTSDLSEWDVSSVTDMSYMFEFVSKFTSDLSEWDVSRVTNMRSMFTGATVFTSDLSEWDVSRVTNMRFMFSGANSFNSDISNWNVSSATDMTGVISNNHAFVQNLGKWYVVLDDTTIDAMDLPRIVGHIAPQTTALTGSRPIYAIGTGGDSESFRIIARNILWMYVAPDKALYSVNITYGGGSLGTNNHRVYDITVTSIDTDSAIAPTLASIERHSPADQNTDSQTLVYKVTFSEDVTGVNTGDFVLSQGSAGAGNTASMTGSGSVYYATVSATQDGTYNLDLVSSGHDIVDATDNPLSSPTPTGADHTYTVSTTPADTTAPTVTSIVRSDPTDETTSAQTLVFAVTFSEDVTGVDAGDFELSGTGAGSITVSAVSGDTYNATVAVNTDGTFNLNIAGGHNIEDLADTGLSSVTPTGADQSYTVDRTAPAVTSIVGSDPSGELTSESTLVFEVTFSEDVTGVDAGDFELSGTGAGSITVSAVSGDTYNATVAVNTDGTFNLNIAGGHNIEDLAGTGLSSVTPTGADQSYTVDRTAPAVTSIVGSDPSGELTSESTLVFEVTFSEDVTGVDLSDFALSPDSTGGGSGSGQFTQTRSPALAITENNTVSDTITVPDSGTATSVSVAIDISHTWIGDLKVDLMAPDGTAKTLHNRTGDDADDIDQTYAPDFAGVPIAGAWTLRINDNYAAADDGTLDSWTLTINYGSSTASPVTTVSGSGDTYHVTVSAAQDGTYNLDLVPSGHDIADTANNPLSSPTPTGADHTYTVSAVPADTAAPTVTSIVRSDPTDETTSAQTLVFAVTFSEDVTGVDAGDFELSGTGAGSITVSAVSGDTYNATVAVNTDGTFNLNIAGGHNIEDLAGTGLSSVTPTGADQSYTVDRTAPAVTSIVGSDPSGELTSESTLVFEVTFSEDVTGVDAGDFELSGTGAGSITVSAVSGDTYNATVAVNTDGTFNLNIAGGHNIEDLAGTGLSSVTPTGADQSYTVDRTAPAVTSIVGSDPSGELTSESTLVFEVTFSEDVTGVDAGDFELSPDSTGGGSGSGQFTQTRPPALAITENNTVSDTITVPDSGTATSVSVAIDISHTWIGDLKVDLMAPDGTAKTLHNRTGGSANDIDQTYAPDFAGVPIAGAWTLRINDNYAAADDGTLDSWTLTINYGSSTASPVTTVSGSGDTYHVTVSAAQDGTYNLDLVPSGHDIADTANNPLSSPTPTGADHTYTVSAVPADTAAPTVTSIVRSDPTDETTSAQTLVFAVTFSEDVTGVDAGDFELSGTGAGSITVSAVSGDTYNATVAVNTDGTFNLNIAGGHNIEDLADTGLSSVTPTGADQSYTVDRTAPAVTSIVGSDPSGELTSESTLVFEVTFSEDVTGVDAGDFELSGTGAGSITVSAVSGDTYNATVAVNTDGTFNLNIAGGHNIEDLAGTGLSSVTPTGADQSYTVDRTAPAVTSIVGSDPSGELTSESTLVFEVTFSEDVTGVDLSDFALSPDSTGGGSGSGQFTQTRSPALAITENNTVSDTITVPDSGTATSVSVAIDISHTWIGDLKVDLMAPDGTAKTLHNRTGDDADDIDQTYAPDFAGVPIAGAWTLRINDNYAAADDGTLDSWTLTINYGSSTASPVTTVSGSGDTYHVTVSAAQDGTYNLDLVPSGHDIADTANNPLSSPTPTGADHTYTVSAVPADTAAPTVTSIVRSDPTDETTSAQTLVFAVTFSEDVTGVDAGDFELSGTGAGSITVSAVSGDTYNATVAVNTDGTFNLNIAGGHNIEDLAGTGLSSVTPTGADQSYTVDRTAPAVTSIVGSDPSGELTSESTLVFEVTFSEDVTGVDLSDFALSPDSTGGGSGSGQFTQTRSPALAITENNTVSDTITVPDSGTATSVSVAIDISHTWIGDLKVDLMAPDGTAKTLHNRTGGSANDIDQTYAPDFAGVPIAGAWTLRINDNYAAADDGTLDSWTLTINYGSSTASPVTTVSGSGDTYHVTVSAAQDGTYNLDLVPSGHDIADTANNPLSSPTPTGADHTYTVSAVPADTAAPTVTSIVRSDPTDETTSAQTLVFAVTFSEDVTGVDAGDFELSGTGAGSITVSAVSGDTYNATVAVNTDGTFNLNIAGGHNIEDLAGTGLSSVTPTGADQSYTVDRTAPAVTSIVGSDPSGELTSESTLVFEVTFSEDVTGVDAGDFELSGTGAGSITVSAVSGDTYNATVAVNTDGTFNLNIAGGHNIEDLAGTGLSSVTPTGADQSYTVDRTAPAVTSIVGSDPSGELTSESTLVFEVTFSEDVTGVDTGDFELSPDSTGGGSGSGQFTQTRSPTLAITENNTVSDTITVPDSGTATSVSVAIDISHTWIGDLKVDLMAPDGTAKTLHNRTGGSANDIDQTYAPDFAGVPIAGAWTLRINDDYAAADDGTLDSWTLTINYGSSTASPVTTVSGSGDTYHVTVSAAQDGTYNLDLVPSGHDIADTANNPLSSPTPTGTDHTYTVSAVPADTAAPTVTSIVRSDPTDETTSAQTLVFAVTFSEDVTGVDVSDFALSPNSTGGGASATGQFAQTSEPALPIPDRSTIRDAITVGQSGNATSVSVAVDVTHTYIGDLKIDIIAPDGTTRTLHDRTGYETDDIDQTYAPDFAGVSIADDWTLRVHDGAGGDTGTLNGWTLTINRDATATNPVTSVSGSGSTYDVTVSVTQDGTYNLDLVSSGHGITNGVGNPLSDAAPTGVDETYTVSAN